MQIQKKTNAQMHKYTNTQIQKVADRPCAIFWKKVMDEGPQKQGSQVSVMHTQ